MTIAIPTIIITTNNPRRIILIIMARSSTTRKETSIVRESYAFTFGNGVENQKGMQIIGDNIPHGITVTELTNLFESLRENKVDCDLFNLNTLLDDEDAKESTTACTLVIQRGCQTLLGVDPTKLLSEHAVLEWDKKALMGRGKNRTVKNKNCRHNLCYADFSQEPDYEKGKGRVVDFATLPNLAAARDAIGKLLPSGILKELKCEGNRYYDINKTYIGFHGDGERKIVVAIRLGEDFPLYYQWYRGAMPIGKRLTIPLSHGDVYIASEKAVGTDWLNEKRLPTLRHAAGEKAIKIWKTAQAKKEKDAEV